MITVSETAQTQHNLTVMGCTTCTVIRTELINAVSGEGVRGWDERGGRRRGSDGSSAFPETTWIFFSFSGGISLLNGFI